MLVFFSISFNASSKNLMFYFFNERWIELYPSLSTSRGDSPIFLVKYSNISSINFPYSESHLTIDYSSFSHSSYSSSSFSSSSSSQLSSFFLLINDGTSSISKACDDARACIRVLPSDNDFFLNSFGESIKHKLFIIYNFLLVI